MSSSNVLRLLFVFVMRLTLTMMHANLSPRDSPLPTLVNGFGIMQEFWLYSSFDSRNSLLIPVYQIRIYISHDDMLQEKWGKLIPDPRIANYTDFISDST